MKPICFVVVFLFFFLVCFKSSLQRLQLFRRILQCRFAGLQNLHPSFPSAWMWADYDWISFSLKRSQATKIVELWVDDLKWSSSAGHQLKIRKIVFGRFHHVLSGPSWVFLMASNGEPPRGAFTSGTDRWEMVESETIQRSIVWWYSKKKKKKSNMFPTPTYQCTLNSITPLPALLSWLQIENLLGLFSHSIIAAIHTRYCCLLLSPLSLVRRSTTHCDNPWIWKTLQKQSPPFLLLPFPAH